MPEYVRFQGVAEVAASGSFTTVASREWCGGSAEGIAQALANLGGGARPVLGAFQYLGVRYVFGAEDGAMHLVTLETEPPICEDLLQDPSALPWRIVAEHRDDLAAAFGEEGAELLEEELAQEPLSLVPSPTGPSAMIFFTQTGDTMVEDVDALARVAVAAKSAGHHARFAAFVGFDGGMVTVDGANVSRFAHVPVPVSAWNEIERIAAVSNVSNLFAQLVTNHEATG